MKRIWFSYAGRLLFVIIIGSIWALGAYSGQKEKSPGNNVKTVHQAIQIQKSEITDTDGGYENMTVSGDFGLFWGDLHGHSNLSDGTGTPEHYYEYARYTSHLDFAALTDHSWFGMDWDYLKETASFYNDPGRFVAFSGYEWTPTGGYHKVVYFLTDDQPMYTWRWFTGDTIEDFLIKVATRTNGFVHHAHPKNGISDWNFPASLCSVATNAEIANEGLENHERYENNIQSALSNGYKLGMVGVSDTHHGQPGSGPLTAVFASELTRESILSGLRERRNYATSGPRIVVDFKIDGRMMGTEYTIDDDSHPEIEVSVIGTEKVTQIEIIRNGDVIFIHEGTEEAESCVYTDSEPADSSYYYIRVTQVDGHMAWSSPIWVAFAKKKGDVNSDDTVNILDLVRVVNIILEDQATEYERWAADCNGDGNIDILDVVGIVNVILGTGTCPL